MLSEKVEGKNPWNNQKRKQAIPGSRRLPMTTDRTTGWCDDQPDKGVGQPQRLKASAANHLTRDFPPVFVLFAGRQIIAR